MLMIVVLLLTRPSPQMPLETKDQPAQTPLEEYARFAGARL
jgi:hypothetical protein